MFKIPRIFKFLLVQVYQLFLLLYLPNPCLTVHVPNPKGCEAMCDEIRS